MDAHMKLKYHAGLVDDAAMRLGLDLQEAAIAGVISFDELENAVTRCMGCARPKDCEAWLNRTVAADAAPQYCRNGALLARVKDDLMR